MAAGTTYESIATTTLSTTQSSVTFSTGIDAYTELILVANVIMTNLNVNPTMRLNGETGSFYNNTLIWSTGTYPGPYTSVDTNTDKVYFANQGASQSEVTSLIINLMNADDPNGGYNRGFLARCDRAGAHTVLSAGHARMGKITSITMLPSSGTFAANSNFSLYGITKA